MQRKWNRTTWCLWIPAALAALATIGCNMNNPSTYEPSTDERTALRLMAAPTSGAFHFPTVSAEHKHVRALLENSMRYIAPESGTIDPASGYIVEGWNHEPEKGLSLRCFTQLTAIGQWVELLADVVAGHADTPYLSREESLSRLTQVVDSLRRDQQDPGVSAKGLLGNFLDLCSEKRRGPLTGDVEKQRFLDSFGKDKGEAIWQALEAKRWIVPRSNGHEAVVQRDARYGASFFDGPLTPYADEATKTRIMELLDQRVLTVVFGDNANLTTSVAKAIGALLVPAIKDRPEIIALRQEMERFLDLQKEGYAHLYDAKAGLFSFGWDATRGRLFGWEDGEGKWQVGHMDYLVNEFRGPATFVALRYGLPLDAVKNLGFKMKPYQTRDGSEKYVLAPWEGSAFQALGLGLSMRELDVPSWRAILGNMVDIQLDYAVRRQLPGFLSESYTGEGPQYTGDVGIPEIAVSTMPRITDVASLYTLGVAYMVAPGKIERFLAENWSGVSKLLTDHGPWEGYNVTRQEPIRVQTSAHTLALVLGLIGTSSENMARYLESRGLGQCLAAAYRAGEKADLLATENQVFAWTGKGYTVQSTREKTAFHVRGEEVNQVGIAFVSSRAQGMNLSDGTLTIRYRSARALDQAAIAFKPAVRTPKIPSELFTRFAATNGAEGEIQIPLPATPGLAGIKEVVLAVGQGKEVGPVDLTITRFAFTPYSRASAEQMAEASTGPVTVGR